MQVAGGGRSAAQAARPGCLEALWGTVVEGDLFSSSNERKYLGFQLFTIILPHLRHEPPLTGTQPPTSNTLAGKQDLPAENDLP